MRNGKRWRGYAILAGLTFIVALAVGPGNRSAHGQEDTLYLPVVIGVDDGAFWSQMQSGVDFRYDIWNGVIKSFVFGIAVSLIAVFEGYDSVPTAEGVSRAITRTVVTSALAILALDFVLTSFMFRGTS